MRPLARYGWVVAVRFGTMLVIWPTSGAVAVVWLIGVYAMVFGAALSLRLRKISHA